MTKTELANELRGALTNEELIICALTCPDRGRLKLPLAQAIALAAETDTLQEWCALVDQTEVHPSSPRPLRALPAVSVVAPHCRELGTRAAKRKRR